MWRAKISKPLTLVAERDSQLGFKRLRQEETEKYDDQYALGQ